MTDEQDRTPIDHALELMVFAPLGFALEARTLLPRFVDRGRSQVELARVVGKFALRKGREDAEAVLLQRQEQAIELLRAAGLLPADPTAPPRSPPGTDASGRAGAPQASSRGPAARREDARPTRADPGIDPSTLAIPGYDSLAASQVVPRLEALDPEELEAIRRYEAAGRARKTILNKIAQIQVG